MNMLVVTLLVLFGASSVQACPDWGVLSTDHSSLLKVDQILTSRSRAEIDGAQMKGQDVRTRFLSFLLIIERLEQALGESVTTRLPEEERELWLQIRDLTAFLQKMTFSSAPPLIPEEKRLIEEALQRIRILVARLEYRRPANKNLGHYAAAWTTAEGFVDRVLVASPRRPEDLPSIEKLMLNLPADRKLSVPQAVQKALIMYYLAQTAQPYQGLNTTSGDDSDPQLEQEIKTYFALRLLNEMDFKIFRGSDDALQNEEQREVVAKRLAKDWGEVASVLYRNYRWNLRGPNARLVRTAIRHATERFVEANADVLQSKRQKARVRNGVRDLLTDSNWTESN